MKMFKYILLLIIFFQVGCSTLKKWWGSDEEKADVKKPSSEYAFVPKYSENPNIGAPSNRQYKRMTKEKMEEESQLNAQAGSMWVMDGQSSYLFAQNKIRKEGDILNVRIEGGAMKQVETKVSVIKKLLKQLEEQQELAKQKLAEQNATESASADKRAPASVEQKKVAVTDVKTQEKEEPLNIGSVPTRITERLVDGSYKVKGSQPFMIGKREYKVIVMGQIRPEDFNDVGVASEKLIDAQYDVVSIRRNSKNE